MEETKAPEQTLENQPEQLTKERKKSNISDEERARRAERMRAMATSRNELLKKQKAERLKVSVEELDKPKEKKPRAAGKPKVSPAPPSSIEQPPAPEKEGVRGNVVPPTIAEPAVAKAPSEKQKSTKRGKQVKARTLVIESSSDSEEYGDSETSGDSSDDEPVIYIAKKSKSKSKPVSKDKGITKPKKEGVRGNAVPQPPPEPPQIRVKFF
jgi:hypothetical protein